MFKLKYLIVTSVFAFVSVYVQAQAKKALTLKEALALGLEHSYKLKESNAKFANTLGRVGQLKASMLPAVTGSASYTRLSNNVNLTPYKFGDVVINPKIPDNYSTRVGVSETIFSGLKAKNALESAKLQEEAGKIDVEKDKSEVTLGIIQAYYSLYKFQQSKRIIQENLNQARENLVNTQNNARQGVVTENDVLRVRLQQTNIEFAEVDVENNLQNANYNLCLLLGLAPETAISPDSASMFSNHTLPDFGSLLGQAVTNRPELRAAGLRILSSEKEAEVLKGNYYPTISVAANYYYMNPSPRMFPQRDIFYPTWDAGISLNYNFMNLYSNKFNLASATALIDQGNAQRAQLAESVQLQLKQQHLAYLREKEKIAVSEKAFRQAQENYRVTRNKYNGGISILTDLLDADALLLQTRINYSTARADAEIAWYNMQYAIGGL